MSDLRVTDAPVARTTDPITSYEAGENQPAREASERAVLEILGAVNGTEHTFAAYDIELVARRNGDPWTPQRLRTAIAQLVRKGLVVKAGVRAGASPTGRAAQTYTLAGGTR